MAFNRTTQTSRFATVMGGACELVTGVTALVAGAATVTVTQLRRVDGVITGGPNAATVSATATNTFTLAGTGTDSISWIAWGQPKL